MKYAKYLIIVALVTLVGYAGFTFTQSKILGGGQANSITSVPAVSPTTQPAPNYPKIIGDFLITDKEICLQDGKPLVYFFGSSTCPHCVWEKPVAKTVFDKFKDVIVYKENFDSQNDGDVFQKYSDINPGYVPFLVLGCKYARVGAGENLGKDEVGSKKLEEEALSVILCKLTNGKPTSVCDSLKTKTSEIN